MKRLLCLLALCILLSAASLPSAAARDACAQSVSDPDCQTLAQELPYRAREGEEHPLPSSDSQLPPPVKPSFYHPAPPTSSFLQ